MGFGPICIGCVTSRSWKRDTTSYSRELPDMKLQKHRLKKKKQKCGVRQNKRESGRAGLGCNSHPGQFAPIDYWTLARFGQGFNEADLPFVDYFLPSAGCAAMLA